MDKQSRPEHSEKCGTLSVRKRCWSCYREYKNNAGKRYIKVIKKPAPRPKHSDMCPTLAVLKKCYACYRSYRILNDPRKRKKVAKANLASNQE